MYQQNRERRGAYCAPELIPYGKLETITAALTCDFNKVGSTNDDATLLVSDVHGDPECL